MRKITEIAKTQPHAAYAVYMHGEQHKYTYFLRTINNIKDLMKPLDDIITNEFIPTLFGSSISPAERNLLAIPVREGGMGIRIWQDQAEDSYNTSKQITQPLQFHINNQIIDLPTTEAVLTARKTAITEMRKNK